MQFEFEFELRNLNDHSNDSILDRVYAKLHTLQPKRNAPTNWAI